MEAQLSAALSFHNVARRVAKIFSTRTIAVTVIRVTIVIVPFIATSHYFAFVSQYFIIDLCRLRYLGVLLGVWDHDSVEPVKEAPVKTKGSTKGSKGTKGGSKGGKPGGTSAVHAKAPSCD